MGTDLQSVLLTKEEIDAKLVELAAKIDAEYAGKDLLIVGVLKGAVMVMADLARALSTPVTMDWMAVSSYGAAHSPRASSGSSRTSTPTSRASTS